MMETSNNLKLRICEEGQVQSGVTRPVEGLWLYQSMMTEGQTG